MLEQDDVRGPHVLHVARRPHTGEGKPWGKCPPALPPVRVLALDKWRRATSTYRPPYA